MAARKLAQEIDKCFKKVDEGIHEFQTIYEKIEQSTNPAQKEKQEENLKREIKKLQRLRDQIKAWAASNEVKDKGPLLEKRKLIETQMEAFKLVEKAMKTKAYSKEGLNAAVKLDPKERAKADCADFLTEMVDNLQVSIEGLEAESEGIQATQKKGKKAGKNDDRIAEIDETIEKHKWHQAKLELIKRSLENGGVETEQVTELEESIRYYVTSHADEDYMGDEEMYDDLNLEEDEELFGINNDKDRADSQETQSVQDEAPEPEPRPANIPVVKSKATPAVDAPGITARRPSTQLKSPLPALATLHQPLSNVSNGLSNMKPAPLPTRAPGETLKYSSAAAAATQNDTNGLAPLPPPVDAYNPHLPPNTATNHPPLPSISGRASSIPGPSPSISHAQPATLSQIPPKSTIPAKTNAPEVPLSSQTKSPALSQSSAAPSSSGAPQAIERVDSVRPGASRGSSGKAPAVSEAGETSKIVSRRTNGVSNGTKAPVAEDQEESIFHLPAGLQDLVESFEATVSRSQRDQSSPSSQRMLAASLSSAPEILDMGAPRLKQLGDRFDAPLYFPQDLDPVFDDPRLYSRIDPDTLFYVFYYKQGTYQQYLAAKALKEQSWRFHKQYQTWFQRHEEPKYITEEFEQGTYRFFDYESTWMNRRKADFKFAYKFLEDDV